MPAGIVDQKKNLFPKMNWRWSCHKISLAFKLILNFPWKCHVTWNWIRNLRTLRSIQWLEMHVGDFRNYSHFISISFLLMNTLFWLRTRFSIVDILSGTRKVLCLPLPDSVAHLSSCKTSKFFCSENLL